MHVRVEAYLGAIPLGHRLFINFHIFERLHSTISIQTTATKATLVKLLAQRKELDQLMQTIPVRTIVWAN